VSNSPAFPCTGYSIPGDETIPTVYVPGSIGLTKRELIAAIALQGFCSLSIADTTEMNASPKSIARWSVAHADALLAELSTPEAS